MIRMVLLFLNVIAFSATAQRMVLRVGHSALPLDSIGSSVYRTENPLAASMFPSPVKGIFRGTSSTLKELGMLTIDIPVHGSEKHFRHGQKEIENLFIVKKGLLRCKLNKEYKLLGPGSVIVLLKRDKLTIENAGNEAGSVYLMSYQSATGTKKRTGAAAASVMISRDKCIDKSTGTGAVSEISDRSTQELDRLNVTATRLSADKSDHEPHRHKSDEIVIMFEGNAQVQIADAHAKVVAGDVIFVASETLHNLTNAGKASCQYLTIQWN